MAVKRKCPDCNEFLPIGSGVRFDDAHNVYCSFCGGVVFAAQSEKERVDKSPKDNYQTKYYGPGSYMTQTNKHQDAYGCTGDSCD